jgi:thiol-disulfide isomerase/thioredoxin
LQTCFGYLFTCRILCGLRSWIYEQSAISEIPNAYRTRHVYRVCDRSSRCHPDTHIKLRLGGCPLPIATCNLCGWDFHVQSFEGKNLASSDWKGHVVIVSFWATWCLPCQAEFPEIAAVQNRYRQNPNVVILALNSGTGGDTPTKAQAFLERKKLDLVGAIDLPENQDFNSDAPRSAATSLGMKTMPVLYILDSSGKLRVIHSGFDSSEPLIESLSREIDGLLIRAAT